jgi:hypothetical protein
MGCCDPEIHMPEHAVASASPMAWPPRRGSCADRWTPLRDAATLRRVPTFEEITRHHDSDPSEDPWVIGPPAPETVTIVPYSPQWPRRYEGLSAGIRATLGDAVLDIEHVGSTSVEGLAAKEVIDMDLTIADPREEDLYVPALERLGYVLVVREPSFHEHRCLRLVEPRANLRFRPGLLGDHSSPHVPSLAA